MSQKLPQLRSDADAEKFVAAADLTQFDLSEMRPVRFEFQAKDERLNMRLPKRLLEAAKESIAKASSRSRAWTSR